ncbi:MAG: hypothetical protein KAR06_03775 [Deltaproteobacteria bacterium]|nr:hypothetical protein [Deltaproteobacteria bacterium]
MDNINVKPGKGGTAVPVKTDVVDGVHVPIYKTAYGADGELTIVDDDNAMPMAIKSQDLTHETDIVTLLNEISGKLSILIKYEAMLHKVNLEEDL